MENTPTAKRGVSTLAKILIAAVLILAAVLVQIFVISGMGQARDMRMEYTGHGVSYDFDAGAMFHSNDSRFFYFATRDVIRLVPSNGNPAAWSETFSFTRPIMASAGDFVAIADYRGRRVYVFNASGRVFRADVSYPVLSFTITDTGLLTTILSYDTGFGVNIFTQRYDTYPGLYSWSVHEFDGIYVPVLAEVSSDGQYIAIAVVDLNVVPNTEVLLLYVNARDAWGTDRGLFATERFDGQLVTAMRFMDGNRLIVAGTEEIRCFQVGPGHAQIREVWGGGIQLHNRLSHIEFYNGSHFAFVTDDRFVGTDEGDPVGTVRIFSVNGVETGSFHLGRRVTHLRMGHNALIVGADRNFHAIDLRGSPLWEHTTLYDTRDLLFLDNTDTVLIAGAMGAGVYRRRRIRENERDMGIQDLEYGDFN
ncbi:MAG: DUF5711 family protein [Defluviitaleaceae bacterium]|nr:DUF5711 family protein [Defluviitaleaceae bacterium]